MLIINITKMETLILSTKTISIISAIGMNVIIKTLTSTTNSICTLITHLTSYDQPGIEKIIKCLKDIDLEFYITVISQLVNEYKDIQVNSTIKKALLGVNDILEEINLELTIIKEAIEYHKTKYFSSWRKINCKCNINTIKKHKIILENRYKILVDLLKINNF